ncbi:zinc finger protein ubi-d4 B isoform X3 [Halyomorpha halys]|uniref:zinc finger protein ubi-d4 B isoform X3 n=1 Tax=Halyomorpha halys TaxID=286706 RepID=UPI0006D4D7B4|nr:zinc finger protein ubi-d4 B isoform X3 [Halyomorpha halys]
MACDIQVVNPSVLSRIESFMNDTSYREAIENSANYNTRLCIERRMRMPFLDSQTGVAQNHSSLFMSPRERIPGLQHGQVYTYPSKRWRKKRRQYLMQPQVQLRRLEVVPGESVDLHTISTLENPAAANSEDSKDSAGVKDESQVKSQPDAWYYEELELQAMEGFDDADPDSDYDYEETYSKKRKKRGAPGKPAKNTTMSDSPHAKKGPKGTGQGRGRKKGINYSEMGDSEKPFSCDRTNNRRGRSGPQVVPSPAAPSQEEPQPSVPPPQGPQATAVPNPQPEKKLSSLPEQVLIMEQNEKERAPPSAYCDFCLGDAVSNKKSGQPEELLSCSDCGRSGHPTCLQFTDNMIVSVRKYRWQCIECKCCSICGTSDNDDQLLFCDDCDRGYHMYCLAPPLHTPPEGSWSCRLCLIEFHDK